MLQFCVAAIVAAGERQFRRGLREQRDWQRRMAALEEEARQRRRAAEEAARAA